MALKPYFADKDADGSWRVIHRSAARGLPVQFERIAAGMTYKAARSLAAKANKEALS